MKHLYCTLLLLITYAIAHTQITVTANDFASAGDTVRISRVQPFNLNGLAYKYGGADTIWDFSQLDMWRQQVDTFWQVYLTDPVYALYYGNLPLNPHRSNVATKGQSNMANIPLSPITINNVFDFFYKTSSHYAQKGIGQDINGIPTVVGYNDDDLLYTFPMQYGNADTSASGYSLQIPGMGYYEYNQTRTNKVDGWGTVITPLGTYPALRLVSKIVSSDSFYIDTIGYGLRRPQPTRREYKWITNGWQAPLVQINTSSTFGNNEAINSIYYRDTVHALNTGISNMEQRCLNIYPNPAQNYFVVQPPAAQGWLTVADVAGRVVWQQPLMGTAITVSTVTWPRGMYIAAIATDGKYYTAKIALQ